ncbi:hypothetical protein MUCCIDRAFT_115100 [Mucor lusitanicus CBS 277.49]|uniref:Major facilitator superfamily (MFS) profile domain-containing protein n=2 Tax=Mucor circinelloides f. lusitanicus TaxID=29924 RepID=A0A168HJC2_MUCCL|nr:hypothetical protein MUCCIDRAFT_115100 [Mucor lusitanicus CBS 277.49]
MKQEKARTSTSNAPEETKEVIMEEEDQTSETAMNEEEGLSSRTFNNQEKSLVKSTVSKVLGDIYSSDDPQLYSPTRKNTIVLLIALIGINGSMAQLIYMPGILQMADDLNTSLPAIDSTVSAYVVFAGIAPLFWSSMSDAYGRKPMYIYSLSIGIVASIICAFSKNVAMLIIFRAMQACGATSGQALGAGVISDLFDVTRRGKAYGAFFVGPLFGTVVGPTIGSLLCQYLGWQATFYFIAIFAGLLLIMLIVLLPETLRKSPPSTNSELYNGKERFVALKTMRNVFTPMVMMVRDPTVVLITLYNTVIYASLFFLSPSMTDTFQSVYHFETWQVGLCYLCLGIGLVISSILSGMYSDRIIKRLHKLKGPENVDPEMRLSAVRPSFFLIPVGFLIYGWTSQNAVGVYAPLIGIFVYALGQMNSLNPTNVYLVDSKPGKSASAMAINNLRSVAAAIVTIFSTSIVRAAGPGVVFSILAGISVLNCIPVLLVQRFGKQWRTSFEQKTGFLSPTNNSSAKANAVVREDDDNV